MKYFRLTLTDSDTMSVDGVRLAHSLGQVKLYAAVYVVGVEDGEALAAVLNNTPLDIKHLRDERVVFSESIGVPDGVVTLEQLINLAEVRAAALNAISEEKTHGRQ